MNLLRSITGRLLVEGHRGAEALAVENSWAAIEAGYQAGADLLELDVHRTLDGILVLHNGYQLPDGRWIRQHPYQVIRDARPRGHALVVLDQALEWVRGKPIGLSLDIKNGFGFDPQVFVDALTRVEDLGVTEQVVFVSWDHVGLLSVKERNPSIATRLLIRGRPVEMVRVVQDAKADAINLDADMVTSGDIEVLHRASIAVTVAEMIDPKYARPFELGADVICCSNPADARAAIDQLMASSTS